MLSLHTHRARSGVPPSIGVNRATNTTRIAAPRQRVWEVLSNGWTYSNWVVGTSHIFAVEREWPAVGSRLFHATGTWPLTTRDETVVEASQPTTRLVLLARGRPLGEARVVIELDDDAEGCMVTMRETPVSGPGKWLHNPLSEAVLMRRNTEALSRLAAIAELRSQPAQ